MYIHICIHVISYTVIFCNIYTVCIFLHITLTPDFSVTHKKSTTSSPKTHVNHGESTANSQDVG